MSDRRTMHNKKNANVYIWGGVIKFIHRYIVLTDKEAERELGKKEVRDSVNVFGYETCASVVKVMSVT